MTIGSDGAKPSPSQLWEEQGQASDNASTPWRLLVFAAAIFASLTLIAAFVPMGAAVIGIGQVVIESSIKHIAHPTGGRIAQIKVRNGERVAKDQLLIKLDDNVTDADATFSSLSVTQLLAEKARLEAERAGGARIIWPSELVNPKTASESKAVADAQGLFVQRRNEEAQIQLQLSARMSQFNQQIVGFQAQIRSLKRQLELIEEERRAIRKLWEKGLVTLSRLNQLERSAADLEGNIASLHASIAQVRANVSETRQQAIQLRESRRVQAGTELAQLNANLNQQRTRSVAANDQQQNREIRATSAGVIEKLAYTSVGELVRPGEPVLQIVPERERKVIETAISPQDIDQVRIGQRANVRFTSFNMATTPEIRGRVIYVAADRTDNPEGQQSYFMARVEIDPSHLTATKIILRSGMPAETYIETGSRSLLSYVFKPLRDQFARAFNDN